MTPEQIAIIDSLEADTGFTYDEVADAMDFSSDGHGDEFESELKAAFNGYAIRKMSIIEAVHHLSLDAEINEKQIAANANSFYTENE